MHAKSLNTDKAWEAYETLVDDYYEKVESHIDYSKLSPELQMSKLILDGLAKVQLENVQNKQIALEAGEEAKRANSTISEIKEILLLPTKDWRKTINDMLNEAAFKLGGGEKFQELKSDSYKILTDRAGCRLNVSLTNLKRRLEESGATKTQIKNASKLDIIENDKRLKEIYTTIVKELSIGTL